MSLATEEYDETLTASSDNSPMRPPQRVMKAAKQTAQAYLRDIEGRMLDANTSTVHKFEEGHMKRAQRLINERQ